MAPPSSLAIVATRAAAGGAPSPRRALSAATAVTVTVTAAEAAPPPHPGAGELNKETSSSSLSEGRATAGAAMGPVGASDLFNGSLPDRVRELEVMLAQVRDELSQERAVHEDEREQLQVLRTMAHDFKIKLAQATQEKVEALMKAAQLAQTVADTKQQQHHYQAQQLTPGASQPGAPLAVIQRQSSLSLERGGRDFSRSPGSPLNLVPATSAPSAPAGGGQTSARSVWATWLGGSGGSWYGTPAASSTAAAVPITTASSAAAVVTAPLPPAGPPGSHISGSGGSPSVASEEGSDIDGVWGSGAAAAATTTAAAVATAHAATVEAAEGRSRRLAAQLERVRSQLAAIDRLTGHVGRCEARLRSCAALLWSSREEDAPRRWAALGDLTRLSEECGALRTEAGVPSPSVALASASGAPSLAGLHSHDVAPVVPLAFTETLPHPHPPQHGRVRTHDKDTVALAASEYDSSVVCTREAGGVQRRVAEVLLGTLEFGVRSLEQYNHQSALSSVLHN
ncbi:hypothetical protein Vretimale_4920 [Volvox reticuliferus]|nr:hypothetical protein Vretifemale_4186 [Volvox reticuliferus]GIL99870.1 hypothetical protein Vretimale_4920 [Volvox reticuliferus]